MCLGVLRMNLFKCMKMYSQEGYILVIKIIFSLTLTFSCLKIIIL
jgi:hypothetical protein